MHLKGNRGNFIIIALLISGLLSSCSEQMRTKVMNPPVGKPFVYSNKINLSGNLSKEEKKRLTYELEDYWEDSLQVRKIQRWLIFYRIKNPAVYDSANIPRSINFMNAYLNAQGYFYATLQDSLYIDTVKNQMRANVVMNIDVGKNITIDTVAYNMSDSILQTLSLQKKEESDLKQGRPYTKNAVSTELDRLTALYRENGFYNFTREDLQAVLDTVDTRLLNLTLDPFKQAELIAEAARKRRENPSWKIELRNKPSMDSSKLRQYYIGQIYYYPELTLYDVPDSMMRTQFQHVDTFRRGIMKYNKGLFRFRPLREHTHIERGDLYNQKNYFKTLTRFSQVGAWQQADAINIPRGDSLDVHIFLVPAVKQSASIDLEGSRNSGDVITGNTLGISTNLSLVNRNIWKQAVQSRTTLRAGVELNLLSSDDNPLLQTYLVNASHTYVIPRILHPFGRWRKLRELENMRTLVALNSSFVDRRGFYKINNYVGSIGYEWSKPRPKRNGDDLWLYKPLNIEIYGITRLPGLDLLIQNNPFLQASFNEGNVVSQSLTFNRTTSKRNKSNFYRLSVEEAGGLFGLLPGLKNNIYRFLKTEAEYKHRTLFLKNEMAYRVFLGLGYNYGNGGAGTNRSMPFFKQFIAGGPYSMRAWGLRQLGLGSSQFSDTVNSTYRDRFGDMQLEANIEYRFQLAALGSFKIGSAVFADIGNIWNLKSNNQDPDSRFSFRELYRDLAIGVGTGLRLDFSYFLIRFDFAYKVKDPARNRNGGWMSFKDFVWSETRPSGLKVNNVAMQFGIGLPF